MKRIDAAQSGQVLLMTMLALAVATTIGLALIGRTSTDVGISNRIEESARAFSAAEAGIEQALLTGESVQTTVLSEGVEYQVEATPQGGPGLFAFPQKTPVGNVETLWLAPHDLSTGEIDTNLLNDYGDQYVDICWSNEPTVPALMVSLYYLAGGTEYKTARTIYDPSPSPRINNAFGSSGPSGGCSVQPTYQARLRFTDVGFNPAADTLLLLRLQPLFSAAQIHVRATNTLPLQGTQLVSTGYTSTGMTRKIIAFQEYRSPSVIFDSVIYTPGSFAK